MEVIAMCIGQRVQAWFNGAWHTGKVIGDMSVCIKPMLVVWLFDRSIAVTLPRDKVYKDSSKDG
jgi:hypothetical protein